MCSYNDLITLSCGSLLYCACAAVCRLPRAHRPTTRPVAAVNRCPSVKAVCCHACRLHATYRWLVPATRQQQLVAARRLLSAHPSASCLVGRCRAPSSHAPGGRASPLSHSSPCLRCTLRHTTPLWRRLLQLSHAQSLSQVGAGAPLAPKVRVWAGRGGWGVHRQELRVPLPQ